MVSLTASSRWGLLPLADNQALLCAVSCEPLCGALCNPQPSPANYQLSIRRSKGKVEVPKKTMFTINVYPLYILYLHLQVLLILVLYKLVQGWEICEKGVLCVILRHPSAQSS